MILAGIITIFIGIPVLIILIGLMLLFLGKVLVTCLFGG